ncbi:hypothetical protein BRADI_5g21242v3 [Brachypodium distachyon]|uniref:Uncharacterized protein n=1 Tax=Brachypodium distachyon TaxID=15368 RepID=A0A2K2CIF7_BRADI|nr:hypothetical protein BRADI_5g21242v3 [Brachypodium distachyon]
MPPPISSHKSEVRGEEGNPSSCGRLQSVERDPVGVKAVVRQKANRVREPAGAGARGKPDKERKQQRRGSRATRRPPMPARATKISRSNGYPPPTCRPPHTRVERGNPTTTLVPPPARRARPHLGTGGIC